MVYLFDKLVLLPIEKLLKPLIRAAAELPAFQANTGSKWTEEK